MNTATANTMEKRKVVVAKYMNESVFVIPKGLDLEDEKVVKQWFVKWDILHIHKADGKWLEIEAHSSMGDDAQKYPAEEEIQTANEAGLDDDELDE